MEKVNLAEKFALITEHWRPKVVGADGTNRRADLMHVRDG